MIPVNAENH